MAEINQNYTKLRGNYLFADIGSRVAAYKAANPAADIIRLGIGDVTLPLPGAVVEAMHKAVDDMADAATFQGYPPYYGYDFLLDAIWQHDYRDRGVPIERDEIHVGDGAKSDTGNIGDIFGSHNRVALGDPVYPVYLDTNVMAGRAGTYQEGLGYDNILYMPCTKENGFLPEIPTEKADLIYLCFPNNPTGAVADRTYLGKWVAYAKDNDAVILYDAAYEAYIQNPAIPRSIFEIPGARTCAMEFRSFSKTAGFTGVRCGYTVVPKELVRQGQSLHEMWQRRQATKFNGVPYITQRGAEAVYTQRGQQEIRANIDYYMQNAKIIYNGLAEAGLTVSGGENAPYIWVETPGSLGSWDFFTLLLEKAGVVTTPGVGFGPSGEGYIRLTAFGGREATEQAVERIRKAAAYWE